MNVHTDPFPHLIASAPVSNETLQRVKAEMPPMGDPRWRQFKNAREFKLGGDDSMFGRETAALFERLASPSWCAALRHAFKIDTDLHMSTYGGGYHLIPPGGYLDVHVDFNRHPAGWHRRLNLLIYLNDDWTDEAGGELVLRREPLNESGQVVVAPLFGTMAIFETSDRSWHGHPKPTIGYTRRSLAAYYYTAEARPDASDDHDTVFAGA